MDYRELFIERVRLTLTFDSEKKGELLAELAEERAREFEAIESTPMKKSAKSNGHFLTRTKEKRAIARRY
ncbi:MAG: DUF5667 domain-containing protein [Eubacteriales bacterium]|nr:DUF5667 domain-containing protein [Eubacteriales bacterium]MDD3074514.1 DUF5667 domain-containing protein [Eubacteriales bacterium]MDD4079127.1 DUF5667 domain-containing protein [Eubacteriales bacterium]MDD4769075.1 DUF5667 domain-containing protein [Eubacteriales bacterium]